ncbi:transcriptional regulator, partial [Natrinema soli]
MNEITFAVLGTGGIGRRALEVSQHKDALTPVAACDRHGVAFDFNGLDVDELLAATEGNIDNEVATDGGAATREGESGVKQHGEDRGVIASSQARSSEDPIQEIIDHGDRIDAVLLALPNYEHDFIPRTADRFAEGGYAGVMIDVLKRSRVIDMLDDRSEAFAEAGITFICGAGATP